MLSQVANAVRPVQLGGGHLPPQRRGGHHLDILDRKPGGSSQIVFIQLLLVCWYLVMQGFQGLAEQLVVDDWLSARVLHGLAEGEHSSG